QQQQQQQQQQQAQQQQQQQQQQSQQQVQQQQQQRQQQQQQQQSAANAQGANPGGQQAGAAAAGDLGPFSNVELMNQQKAGMMAQEAGQMVVPASAAGRNATPQPVGGAPAPSQAGGQQGTAQAGRSQQPSLNMQQNQQLQMDQAAAKTQAQIRAQAQAKQMQGQPGGLGGPGAISQSPAMNTLNAPVQRPPVAMGQQMGQGNPNLGPNQVNPRPPPGPANNNRNNLLALMMRNLGPDQQQTLRMLPPEKQNEVLVKWLSSRNQQQQMAGQPQAQAQLGQFAQGNPKAQFTPGGAMGPQPGGNMPMGNAQNPALVQQQLNRMRPNAPGQPAMQADPNTAGAFMDSLDIPPAVLQQIPQLPPTVKKWGQLKQWMIQNNVNPGTQAKILNFQNLQFQRMLSQRAQAAGGAQVLPNAQTPGPQGQGHVVGQMQSQNMGATLQMALQNVTVSPQEIQNARAASDKFRDWNEETVRQYLIQVKQHQLRNRLNGRPQVPTGQQQPSPMPPVPPGPITAAPQPPQRPQSTVAEPPVAAVSVKPPKPAGGNRQTPQQNPSAIPQRPAKRGSDDVVDVTSSTPAPAQRPPSHAAQKAAPRFTPAQVASMPPEQRLKYEQFLKSRQAQAPQNGNEDVERLRKIGGEVQRQCQQEVLPDVPTTPQQHMEMTREAQHILSEMNKVAKLLGRWYSFTHDDNRVKQYFTTRIRLHKQFKDGEAATQPKEVFTIQRSFFGDAKLLLSSMATDLRNASQAGQRSVQGGSDPSQPQATPAQIATPVVQPTPLSATNLEKHNKHVRSGSRSGVPPAAPTTKEPPFQIPSAPSPHGVPTYSNPNGAHMDLTLPNKRRKHGQSAGASSSPQMGRQASLDTKKEKVAEPQYPCPEPDCEASRFAFLTEEARRAHVQEEHIKPREDPTKYLFDAYAEALGLDADGRPKQDPVATSATPSNAPQRLNQTPLSTSMSRGPSMRSQDGALGSTDVAKARGAKSAAVTATSMKREDDVGAQPAAMAGLPHFGTVDPQSLSQALGGFESGGGAISNMAVYRALSPRDTPESSKDGASSEPTSDVSEGIALNVTLDLGFDTWQPFDGDGITFGSGGESDFPDPPDWDEVQIDFDKPFSLDMSMYSFDPTSLTV
ncbi:hypothetical protein LQW54_012849, partial [Pestalotiopsis sp. IQ-011]